MPAAIRPLFSSHRLSLKAIIGALPAVSLGLLLNVLDAVSYGLILFPWTALPDILDSSFALHGISLFMASTIISQLVLSFGGSSFLGGTGSMMIEVIPFLHRMTFLIASRHNETEPTRRKLIVVSTAIFAFGLATIITGLTFFALGALRIGNFVNFFPRSFLIGVIGGVGFFLAQTAIDVSTGTHWRWSIDYFQSLFDPRILPIWLSCLGLGAFLKICQRNIKSTSLIPLFYLGITTLFYLISMVFCGQSLEQLRHLRWLLSSNSGGSWDSTTVFSLWRDYVSLSNIDFIALIDTFPTMISLALFGLLHVPLNLPSLGLTVRHERFDMNKELIGHGLSNLVSGLVFSVPNYLVYCNSVLFIRAGGNSRTAGALLAILTSLIFVFGMNIINFVPTVVVGSLILHLGLDLLWESLYDTWNSMSRLEYSTVIIIILTMAFGDFTTGIIFGLITSFLLFMFNYSRTKITASEPLDASSISELLQRPLLKDFKFIHLIQLQGYLFFGNSGQLAHLLELFLTDGVPDEKRYIVLDFSLVTGIDYSASSELKKFIRIFHSHDIEIILCRVKDAIIQDLKRRKVVRNSEFSEDSPEQQQNITASACEVFESVDNAVRWCEVEWEIEGIGRTYVDDCKDLYMPILELS